MKGPHYQRGFWNFVIPAIAAIGGALLNKEGQEDANAANISQSDKTIEFNREQAELGRTWNQGMWERQRDYNTDMANTQYQRAVGDMQAAGLNPMLAYQQGGNASMPAPSVSSQNASYGNPARVENVTASALAAAGQVISLTNMQRQGENIEADTALKNAQAGRETASAGELTQRVQNLKQDMEEQQYRMANIRQDTMNKFQQQELLEAETQLTRIKQDLTKGEIGLVEAKTAYNKILTRLQELEIPGMENVANYERSQVGEFIPYAKNIGSVLNSAAGAALKFRGLRANPTFNLD